MASPFCLAPDGRVVVCGDGPELLVYDAELKPLWKKFCNDVLVGVGVIGDRVVTVDASGLVQLWVAFTGDAVDETALDARAAHLAVSPDNGMAVAAQDGLYIVDGGGRNVGYKGATAIAYGPTKGSLGVGTEDGKFYAVDPNSGSAWGSVDCGAPVRGVAWSNQNQWVVAAGNRLVMVSNDGKSIVGSVDNQPANLSSPVCSGDGAAIAAVVGHNQVAIYLTSAKKRIGFIHFKREIGQLSMASPASLGIGLDDGDANRFELFSGAQSRTEPHPGRGRTNWGFTHDVDLPSIRGAVAFGKTGGKAIATFIAPPKYTASQLPSTSGPLTMILGVVFALCLAMVCCGGIVGGGLYLYRARLFGMAQAEQSEQQAASSEQHGPVAEV